MTWTTCGGCGKSWDDEHVASGSHVCAEVARLTAERDAAMGVADRWRALCEVATTTLVASDAEVTRLRAQVAELRRKVPGWWCLRGACATDNAAERETCRRCGEPKTNEGRTT